MACGADVRVWNVWSGRVERTCGADVEQTKRMNASERAEEARGEGAGARLRRKFGPAKSEEGRPPAATVRRCVWFGATTTAPR
eukprot:6375469-Prymnesium_polylepis.2